MAADVGGLPAFLGFGDVQTRWLFVLWVIVLGVVAWFQVAKAHDRIGALEEDVRMTAQISWFAANVPRPSPDRTGFRIGIVFEVWVFRDVSTDELGLNVIYLYDRRWWQVWKRTTYPQKGLPPNGQSDRIYRKRLAAAAMQPIRDEASFEYVAPSDSASSPHWLLELVLRTGMPKRTLRVPLTLELPSEDPFPPM